MDERAVAERHEVADGQLDRAGVVHDHVAAAPGDASVDEDVRHGSLREQR
jgi:hypothetical protein